MIQNHIINAVHWMHYLDFSGNYAYIPYAPIYFFGGVLVSTGGFSCHQLQVKRQLVKLAKPLTAKKEDDFVLDEAEFALAA